MRVLLAGATGVIGRALLPLLRGERHHVTVLVRDQAAAAELDVDRVVVADLLDRHAVHAAVFSAAPEVVVHQATALRPGTGDTRWEVFERTARVRTEGTANLVDAALASGTRRVVAQSIAFATAPHGGPLLDEEAPLYLDPPDAVWSTTVRAIAELERLVLHTSGVEGVVLRYGTLYGRDTAYDLNGPFGQAVRLGKLPLIGDGTGINSFLHVEDAADAAATAVMSRATGLFNIVDDDPATARTWLPHYARAFDGPHPRQVPAELGARLLGWFAAHQQTRLRGASNRKAREQLGWRPGVSSWRNGQRLCLVGAGR
ncbi:NAD-dependent epimerase/dehydratase family protein [Kutzneria albida]|uniref:Dehydrogenase n=1 Tax=Kutzneria albida DSM 43870 TaxID=1449976 RepID=W5W479_9PSEU|nr:NAD(P)-dependent oxidoreductase [Kutzneria albida]AHH95627.1 dehydrogenase [Kutzneria albida DSM 43870]